jgi:anti-anti-sigma factor
MAALSFIDSAAMQMIIAARRVFCHKGGTLALVGPVPAVARTLKLAGVSDVIPVYGSLQQALALAG